LIKSLSRKNQKPFTAARDNFYRCSFDFQLQSAWFNRTSRRYRARYANRFERFVALDRHFVNRFDNFHSARNASESGESSVQVASFADKNKKVCRRAVRRVRPRHRQDSAFVFYLARLVRDALPGAFVDFGGSRRPRRKIAALHDETGNDAAKVVVSRNFPATRLRKLRTVSGALSGNISNSITPASVSTFTHCAAISATVALANGSTFSTAGRRFALFEGAGEFTFVSGDFFCASAAKAKTTRSNAVKAGVLKIFIFFLLYPVSKVFRIMSKNSLINPIRND
jgi:hypothetical protein